MPCFHTELAPVKNATKETYQTYKTSTRAGDTHVICTHTTVCLTDDQAGCAQIYKVIKILEEP